jgi:hypothetical protein
LNYPVGSFNQWQQNNAMLATVHTFFIKYLRIAQPQVSFCQSLFPLLPRRFRLAQTHKASLGFHLLRLFQSSTDFFDICRLATIQ